MKVSTTTTPPDDLATELLLWPLTEAEAKQLPPPLADLMGEARVQAGTDFSGAVGEQLLVYSSQEGAVKRIGLLGLGPQQEVDAERLRRAAAKGASLALDRKLGEVMLHLPGNGPRADEAAQAVVEGFYLGAYRFRRYKTEEDGGYTGPERLRLHVEPRFKDAVARGGRRGRYVGAAVCSARDLVNRSPDEKTARLFAQAIEEAGREHGFAVEVWDKARIEEERMGGLLAVNRGSEEPPTFTVLRWAPEEAVNERPVVLVGKGIVFDTGGLSLKDTKNSMDMMKADMAGAAAVVGAFEAIADLGLPLHVVGLVPATDNRPGKNAYVPGDVIRMHAGMTVEVLNTDAEGRLILADALSYARSLDPALVIDLATLTGAAVIALGSEVAALMTNTSNEGPSWLQAMQAAGRRSGDRVHPLPMHEEYAELLESDVADLKNVGGREAGCITAGKFLEHFTDYPWLHLDIAGPAFLQQPKPYRLKGGTGFGVRLLVAFLQHYQDTHRVQE